MGSQGVRQNKSSTFILSLSWLRRNLYRHTPLTVSGEGNGTPLRYSCLESPMDGEAWGAAVRGVAKSRTQLSDFPFTFYFHALEKEMATHSSVLACRIPGTVEPSGLPSVGSHRVGLDCSDLAAAAAGEWLGAGWMGPVGVEEGQIDISQTKHLLLSKVLCLGLASLKPDDSLMPDPLCLPRDILALIRFFSLLLYSV